ncbi:MAG TPA: hypothetical protein PKY59_07605 [Pyrinomonadaceae bacterium]|nr:hypothetical protein [Pyrinomonadaceae bacterium]
MRGKIDHWMMKLPDFMPTSSLKREVWEIEKYREEIEWLNQQIEDAENRIVKRILAEYTTEEINIARAKFENAKR